jgi:hypothetical protein
MAAFQFYLQSGKQIKVGWVGDDGLIVLGQKFPGEKGSVRPCLLDSNIKVKSKKKS